MASTPSDDALYGSEKDEQLASPTSDVAEGLESPEGETPEERERRMTEMKEELEKVESEIHMLRQVLGSKVRHATELKRQMGITPFQEFKSDLSAGINQIKSSDSYQKTNAVLKTGVDKTSSGFSYVGQVMSKKMGDLKNSNAFKSMDERVSATYSTVKAKVTGSRSSQDIDEAFANAQISEDGVVIPGVEAQEEEKVPL